jgi:ankyrin repeat protein
MAADPRVDLDLTLLDAVYNRDTASAARCLAAGADPNAFVGLDTYSPLQAAAYQSDPAIVVLLLRAGATVDGRDMYDHTALCHAAGCGHMDVMRALIEAGGDVAVRSGGGTTPLHFAALTGQTDACHLLLECGARADVRNHSHRLPADLVSERHLAQSPARNVLTVIESWAPWSRRRPVAMADAACLWSF